MAANSSDDVSENVIEQAAEALEEFRAAWAKASKEMKKGNALEWGSPNGIRLSQVADVAASALASLRKAAEGSQRVWWCARDRRGLFRTGDGVTCPVCGFGELAFGCGWRTLLPEPGKEPR